MLIRLLALALAVIGSGCGSSVAHTGTSSAASSSISMSNTNVPPLIGTKWWLDQIEARGEPVEISDAVRSYGLLQFVEDLGCDSAHPECPMGPILVGSDGCNDLTQSVAITADAIQMGLVHQSSAVGCDEGLSAAMQTVFTSTELRYSVEGDLLHPDAAASDLTLTYRRWSDPFGPATGEILDEGQNATTAYRLR